MGVLPNALWVGSRGLRRLSNAPPLSCRAGRWDPLLDPPPQRGRRTRQMRADRLATNAIRAFFGSRPGGPGRGSHHRSDSDFPADGELTCKKTDTNDIFS